MGAGVLCKGRGGVIRGGGDRKQGPLPSTADGGRIRAVTEDSSLRRQSCEAPQLERGIWAVLGQVFILCRLKGPALWGRCVGHDRHLLCGGQVLPVYAASGLSGDYKGEGKWLS